MSTSLFPDTRNGACRAAVRAFSAGTVVAPSLSGKVVITVNLTLVAAAVGESKP